MKVRLGTFARKGIEAQLGADLVETVETAVNHYTLKIESGRPPMAPPQFLGTSTSSQFGTSTSARADQELEEIEITLDSHTEALLRREAMRHGIDVDAVTAHSVMIYLAELDFLSGASRAV